MHACLCSWPAPFTKAERYSLEQLLIYARGSKVSITQRAQDYLNMWRLSKDHGIKPWEYWGDYDEQGNPVLYQEDILMLRWFDDKEAEYEYRQSNKGGGGLGAKGGTGQHQPTPGIGIVMPPGETFRTTVSGPPQPDRPAPADWGK